MAHRTRRRLVKALARQRAELLANPPYVCPGCHAIGGEPCLPGCIDAEIEAEREDAFNRGDYDRFDDDDDYEPYNIETGRRTLQP